MDRAVLARAAEIREFMRGAKTQQHFADRAAVVVMELLDLIQQPTTRTAAEHRVLDAVLLAERAERSDPDTIDPLHYWIPVRAEAVRFRDVLTRATSEECGAPQHDVGEHLLITPNAGLSDRGGRIGFVKVKCHLLRGHDGEHEGDLGNWRWP